MFDHCPTIPTFALALLLTTGAMAQDGEKFHFIDRDLVRLSGDLVGLTETGVRYRDVGGRVRSLDRASLLAVYSRRHHGAAVPASVSVADAAGEVAGVLRLSDGQLIPGFLLTGASTADAIRWRSRRVGEFAAPLDRVRSLALNDTPVAETGTSDVVVLTNADRLEGFVESIGAELTIEVASGKQSVPMERVSSVRLASEGATSASQLVFLTDGSILAAGSIMSSGATPSGLTVSWALAGDGSSGVLDLGAIDAIVFEPGALRPLAWCEIIRHEPLQSRRWAPLPRIQEAGEAPIGLASITIDGPAACEWRLPAHAKRLRATLSLPESARVWGNTTVVVSAASGSGSPGVSRTFELTSDKPEAEVRLDCGGMERLRVEVLGRGYDQVQARVMLLEPAVLVETR